MRISAVKRRNAWRRAIREVGVLFVAFGLGDFAFTIFRGNSELLPVLFLAILLSVAGLLSINYSIETEEEETVERALEEIREEEEPQEVSVGESFATIKRRLIDTVERTRAEWSRRYWPDIGSKSRPRIKALTAKGTTKSQ
jgi:hypothetical protein